MYLYECVKTIETQKCKSKRILTLKEALKKLDKAILLKSKLENNTIGFEDLRKMMDYKYRICQFIESVPVKVACLNKIYEIDNLLAVYNYMDII